MVVPSCESCGIAFKEWASVCDALLDGRQTIILRKGGVSEGTAPGFFVPEHSEFWLYPTWVHQAEQGVREGATDATIAPAVAARPAPAPPKQEEHLDAVKFIVVPVLKRVIPVAAVAAGLAVLARTLLRRRRKSA